MSDIDSALEWADWLAKVKDPGPALLAAKKHGEILAREYRKEKDRADDAEYREAQLEKQAVIFRNHLNKEQK
jgi:hypothetical protein